MPLLRLRAARRPQPTARPNRPAPAAPLSVRMIGLLLLLSIGVAAAGSLPLDAQDAPEGAPAASPASARPAAPVLLLTGFEPFGPGRPANPSWEGVKGLDGREWHGYRIVCRQLRCVWGQPLVQLDAETSALAPVAIFSFGQGLPGAFAIETRAANRRGGHPDNEDRRPATPVVVADGPAERQATCDAPRLRELLAARGHQVRVSKNAGRYLCEETLYTLEHLKARDKRLAHVLFCHVPPLDPARGVTPEFVQEFVLDMLDAWRQTAADKGPAKAPTGTAERVEPVQGDRSPAGDSPDAAPEAKPEAAPQQGSEQESESATNAQAATERPVKLVATSFTLAAAQDDAADAADGGRATGGDSTAAPAKPSKPAPSKPVREDPRTAEVKKFIDRYFRTWSNREMDAYGDGFLREAVVQHLDERGQVDTQATPEFLANQRRFQALRPAKEFPLAADVRFEGPLARAVVYWKLEDGQNPPRYGYDHFTLVRRDGQWKILNLVFYGVDPPKNENK